MISLALMFACTTTPSDTGTEPTAEEMAAADESAEAWTAVMSALVFTDVVLFEYDPDLDENGTAASNSDTIQSNLGGDAGCAAVTVTDPTHFTVDFGTGCTYGTVTVAGALSVGVDLTGEGEGTRTLSIALGMQALDVNGVDLDGDVTFTTSNATTFTVVGDLTHSGTTLGIDLTVVGALGYTVTNGTIDVSVASGTGALALTGVEFEQAACWPRSGSIAITGTLTGTITFDVNTPTTGQATLAIGPWSDCYALPSYGSCTATACPSGAE